jgi:hypothetical protein
VLEFRPTINFSPRFPDEAHSFGLGTFCSLCLFGVAKNRNWQDAILADIRSTTDNNGVAAMPIGSMVYGVPIRRVDTYLSVDAADMKYVLYAKPHRKPLNLTVHGKTKIAVEGTTAYLLDDGGKELKLPIVQKEAKTE